MTGFQRLAVVLLVSWVAIATFCYVYPIATKQAWSGFLPSLLYATERVELTHTEVCDLLGEAQCRASASATRWFINRVAFHFGGFILALLAPVVVASALIWAVVWVRAGFKVYEEATGVLPPTEN
jgi:hypothetical protein